MIGIDVSHSGNCADGAGYGSDVRVDMNSVLL
jgi:hypothetical protein